jgi:hypothetical protein
MRLFLWTSIPRKWNLEHSKDTNHLKLSSNKTQVETELLHKSRPTASHLYHLVIIVPTVQTFPLCDRTSKKIPPFCKLFPTKLLFHFQHHRKLSSFLFSAEIARFHECIIKKVVSVNFFRFFYFVFCLFCVKHLFLSHHFRLIVSWTASPCGNFLIIFQTSMRVCFEIELPFISRISSPTLRFDVLSAAPPEWKKGEKWISWIRCFYRR